MVVNEIEIIRRFQSCQNIRHGCRSAFWDFIVENETRIWKRIPRRCCIFQTSWNDRTQVAIAQDVLKSDFNMISLFFAILRLQVRFPD